MSMIHEITAEAPRNKKAKRKGRGDASGKGKTAGRGTKGTGARAGKYIRRGYEGGQTEIYRRFPKRGFSNENFATRYSIVNLADLDAKFDAGATVDVNTLAEKGLIPNTTMPVKILGNGEITKKLSIQADWYSKSAIEKLGKVGGSILNAKGEAFAFPKLRLQDKPKKEASGESKKK
jgi:large subunit ribosomal protein L15